MSIFRETFPSRARVLLPVVHCISESQARRGVDVAMENGADGVWLINQGGMDLPQVSHLTTNLCAMQSYPFVGMNLLGISAIASLIAAGNLCIDGLWVDDAGVRGISRQTMQAMRGLQAERSRLQWGGLYFGGVAFKYRPEVPADKYGETAFLAALGGVDVVTTSGEATGAPPVIEKIAAMAHALNGHPLAIASGITPDNIDPYLPHAQAFLVATGIESAFGVFDPAKVRALAEKIHA